MDFIVELPTTKNGYDAILVFVDRLSKMCILCKCRSDATAADTAGMFLANVFNGFGLPKTFVSDRGTQFTSIFFKELCSALGVRQSLSTAYHPQTDGQTERVNRVLEDTLRAFVSPRLNDWDELLPIVEFAINDSKQDSTGYTPFYLMYGLHPLSPVDVVKPNKQLRKELLNSVPAVTQLVAKTNAAVAEAKLNLVAAQHRQKLHADGRRSEILVGVGDKVMLSTKNINIKAGTKKLLPRWIGPFKVIDRISGSNSFRLELPANMSRVHPVFHASLLKPFIDGG
jgi:hypothetical protein